MSNLQHQFKPLEAVRSISVRWELSQDAYEKLRGGNDAARSHWHFFMENDIVHIYKGFGGNEHYRFTLNKQAGENYLVEEIETHNTNHSEGLAKFHGWTKTKIEEYGMVHDDAAIEEVANMLSHFFDIALDTNLE